MSKQSGIISNRKVEALHPATLKGRGFTAGQGKVQIECLEGDLKQELTDA